jgi:ethanolamine utilization protein EutA (predicted chaperonin)
LSTLRTLTAGRQCPYGLTYSPLWRRRSPIRTDAGRPDPQEHSHDGYWHSHADGDDHDHGHGRPPAGDLLEAIEGIERHTLHSVGIDIGSATSHLAVSQLVLQRRGADLSSEFVVSRRETLYQSPIWLTPYRSQGTAIDVAALRRRFEDAYREAGVAPDQLDTGAVVITGEALKKENAEQIARMLAGWSGRFVCVSAGPYHEGVLAAHGSGAVALSEQSTGTVVNVDVGGGTTKVTVVRGGEILHVEAFSVGARLIAFDEHDRITRLEEPGRALLERLGVPAGLGEVISAEDRRRTAQLMADTLLAVLTAGDGPRPALFDELFVSSDGRGLPDPTDIDTLVFSGGVSEYLVAQPPASFGDLGDVLGQAIRAGLDGIGCSVRRAAHGIRATVVGASQHTVQASGVTCYLSDRGLLPVHGLRAIRLDFSAGTGDSVVANALAKHELPAWQAGLAAAVTVATPTTYAQLRSCAEALVRAVSADPGLPLFVVLRQDLARSLGGIIREELGHRGPVIAVDGISIGELDHVDLGRPLGASTSLPVTVTSLLFPHPHHQTTGAKP